MICAVKDCGKEIHPERLAAIPSGERPALAPASGEHQRELRRANSARRRERNKKEKARMSKRIYTFEVEIDDVTVHERYDDGTCDHQASVSCELSIARALDTAGRNMARCARRDSYLFDKVDFIESYSEDEWDDLIYHKMGGAKGGLMAQSGTLGKESA